MDAPRKKIPTIDFRPRRSPRWRFLAVALLLLGGVVWVGWRWIAPYDRAHLIERQLETATALELGKLLDELPGLAEPGYRVLFGTLGHPQIEVRRAARMSVGKLLDRWQELPSQQPQDFAVLTVLLAEQASTFPSAERQEAQAIFRRWVNLVTPEKIRPNLAQREFHARRQMLEWIMEPRLAQPPRLQGKERAEQMALLQELLVRSCTGMALETAHLAARSIVTAVPLPSQNQSTFQVVVTQADQSSATVESHAHVQLPDPLQGTANRAMQLSSNPYSETRPITPLNTVTNETPSAVRRAAAIEITTADLLATDAPARYRRATPVDRRQLLAEYLAAGCPAADLEMLELYATAPPAVLAETINALPQRTDVQGQLWLRQFAAHPDSTVRRAAWSWLITSSDRATRQWLAERAAVESDAELREWYQAMNKQRKVR